MKLFLLITLSTLICNHKIVESLTKSDYLYWNSETKLSWADFKATPPVKNRECVNAYMPLLPIASVKNDSMAKVSVFATFYRDSSWVRPDCKILSYLIQQRTAFDINEVYARKIMNYLQKQQGNVIDMKQIMAKYSHERDSLVSVYFNEIGISSLNQDSWENKVDSMLNDPNNSKIDSAIVVKIKRRN